MSAHLDPEDLRVVIGAYHQCVADTVGQFDGFVARFMGDGALVYFGFPQSHEDNAERAVRAALALVSAVGTLTALDKPLSVRIGIATGLVVVGELVSAGAAREQTAMGETPNLAARLQALAEPNAIVITDNTRRLAGDRFTYRDLGNVAIKGYDAPAHIWQVTGSVHAVDSFALLRPDMPPRKETAHGVDSTSLVGRAQELGLLQDCWAQVTEGEGRVVLLMGDPGIGKSRLVQTLIAEHRVRVSRAARVALFGISRQQPAASDHLAALERAELEPSGFRRDQAREARRLLRALPGFVDGGPSAADLAALVAAIEALSRFRR